MNLVVIMRGEDALINKFNEFIIIFTQKHNVKLLKSKKYFN